MNRNGLCIIGAVVLANAFATSSLAGVTELPSIAPTEVYITNTSSSHVVNFTVSGNRCSPPVAVSLKPDHYGTYSCDGASSFSFSITTAMASGAKISRTANLGPTKRYEIYSESGGVWNIREITSR